MNELAAQTKESSGIVQRRPLPTLGQVKTFAQAMFTAKRVAPEIVEQRIAICRQCDKRRVTPEGVEWCRNCGCKVSKKSKEIMNLAAYEENLPKWGCKHPKRKEGKGWARLSPVSAVPSPESADNSRRMASGVPPNGSGVPLEVSDAPPKAPGVPPETPAAHPELPGVRLKVSDAHLESPGVRLKLPGAPPEGSDVPPERPGVPPVSSDALLRDLASSLFSRPVPLHFQRVAATTGGTPVPLRTT